ncbi:hypothetical protein LINGRAHAP2_LOCUS5986 [Linum grandiflorum]
MQITCKIIFISMHREDNHVTDYSINIERYMPINVYNFPI